MHYSKSTNGFYSIDIHQEMPSDAVEISDETYVAMLQGQTCGKAIVSDSDGNPTLQDMHISAVPSRVPMIAAKRALLHAGLLDDAEAELQGIEDELVRRDALLQWQGQWLERDDPLVQQVVKARKITTHQLDDLFTSAARFAGIT